MSKRLATAIPIVGGLIMIAAVACAGSPASPQPTQTPTVHATQPPTAEPAPAVAQVTGTVTYRERIALSSSAVVEVVLQDVSRADAPAIVVGEATIENPGQVPVSFQILYDPNAIDERFTYAVRATITDRGRMLFTTTQAYNVITRGNPTHLDMVLQGVAAPRPTRPPAQPDMVATPAPVETVHVVVSDSLEYSLRIVSGLPGGCVKFEGYELERDRNLVRVTVTNLKPSAPVPCTTIYGRHEGELDLGTDFTPGESYTLVVNDEVTNAFVARDPEGPEMVLVDSPIAKAEILVLESFPPQYRLQVVSRLPLGSSCSKFNGYDVTRPFANTIHVKVTHLEVAEKNVPCTRDLPAVVTDIPLGSDFTPGEEYEVVINEQATETFKAQ